jgi:DNA polymerase-3 subunit delta'
MAAPLSMQPHIAGALRRALQTGRLGHGLLLSGPQGSGRERTAIGLAAALLCQEKTIPFGCGRCRACRRVLSGHHPDVHLVVPEVEAVRRGLAQPDAKRKPSADILVDAVRELALRMQRPSFEGGARVAIIVDAQRMTDSAQNALLKTLEEPAAGAWLVLIVPHERTVLPTIASRCLRLRTAPPALSISPAAAPPAAQDESAEVLFHALLKGSFAARMDAAESAGKERGDVDAALAGVADRVAASLRRDANGEDGVPWRRATALLENIGAARDAIARNASVQLVLEELLLSR